MGIQDGDIEAVNPDKMETVKELLKNMIDEEENEILTILQGEEATEEEVQAIESFIEEEYDEIEVEIHKGNQPIYSFIFSVE